MVKNNSNSNLLLPEKLDFKLIRQWQLTISVFNGITFTFKVILDVAFPTLQNWNDYLVLPFMLGVLLSHVVFSISQTYLEIFVPLDKI